MKMKLKVGFRSVLAASWLLCCAKLLLLTTQSEHEPLYIAVVPHIESHITKRIIMGVEQYRPANDTSQTWASGKGWH